MSALVDKAARLAAMANLAKHFLSQAYEGGNTAKDRKARHDAIKREVSPCGLFDAHDIVWLFYLLEERGVVEINKFAALAQTTDPEAMLQHGIPKEIVDNANLLKEHHAKATRRAGTAPARASTAASKDEFDFKEWAKKNINVEEHSGKIQAPDLVSIKGFKWGKRTDGVLKKWVKEVHPDFKFKTGRNKVK